MSSVIQLLPDHIANQIAAGEVIQRPASVIKELMENAIDAGATRVDVVIKDAGRSLIQVTDNGQGMSELDAQMCFERHATSKLHNAADLFNLHTKGFRGEALASIAAISHVNLQTKQANSDTGITIQIEGSEVKNKEDMVCADGTSFMVKNLFFNVPARRNFLKSDSVEFKHIISEFERLAIPHFDIHFTLSHNDDKVYTLPSSNLKQRIVNLFGANTSDKLVPLEECTEIVGLSGFVGKPEFARKTRGEQYFFVNNRFFKSHQFHHSVMKAFNDLLKPNTFPSYFIFFDVDPAKLDVNVHPTKTEIKFEEERFIYTVLLTSIKNSLGKFNIMPSLDFEAEMSFEVPTEIRRSQPQEPIIQTNNSYNPFRSTEPVTKSSGQSPAMKNAGFSQSTLNDWNNYPIIEEDELATQQFIEIGSTHDANWFFSSPYMITKARESMLFIHYKRAYERVTYDEMMQSFILHPIASQGLLFPIEVKLGQKERHLWESNETMLHQVGLEWRFVEDTLQIASVPAILQEDHLESFIDKIIAQLDYSNIDKGEMAHHFILTLAKSAAQQRNIVTNNESANELMQRLSHCEDSNYSPTGLKINRILTNEQIENL
jgi:DNA mismatch repair protein MutL